MEAVDEYLTKVAPEQRAELEAVRQVVLDRLPDGYEEQVVWNMLCYVVPHSTFPQGYHCDPSKPLMYAALAAQKNHCSLYLMSVYGDEATSAWFREEHAKRGKKLDMGKSCVRFKSASDLDLDLIGDCIARVPMQTYVDSYLAILNRPKAKR